MAPLLIPLQPSGEPLRFFNFCIGGQTRPPFTARIERTLFHRARSASKKSTWPLPASSLTRKRSGYYSENPIEIAKLMRV